MIISQGRVRERGIEALHPMDRSAVRQTVGAPSRIRRREREHFFYSEKIALRRQLRSAQGRHEHAYGEKAGERYRETARIRSRSQACA
jgi:hypothetical protein